MLQWFSMTGTKHHSVLSTPQYAINIIPILNPKHNTMPCTGNETWASVQSCSPLTYSSKVCHLSDDQETLKIVKYSAQSTVSEGKDESVGSFSLRFCVLT